DQASWWARPVPATTADKSRPRHADGARSQYGSHRAAGPQPGALPPRSTATTLTDSIEANSATHLPYCGVSYVLVPSKVDTVGNGYVNDHPIPLGDDGRRSCG